MGSLGAEMEHDVFISLVDFITLPPDSNEHVSCRVYFCF